MAYSTPKRITYSRAIATSDATWAVRAPVGATGVRVVDINASVTTTYNAVTTAAKIGVGVAGNVNDLGYVSLGTTAAGSTIGWADQYVHGAGTNPKYQGFTLWGADNTLDTTEVMPDALGPVLLTFTANTGGSPAGAGYVDVTLDWI